MTEGAISTTEIDEIQQLSTAVESWPVKAQAVQVVDTASKRHRRQVITMGSTLKGVDRVTVSVPKVERRVMESRL